MREYIVGTLTFFLVFGAANYQNAQTAHPAESMIQLIATPERFDGKQVSVVGFARLEHEAYLLYLSKHDYDNVILANALWIDATEDMGRNRDKLELKYVKVVGTFRAGHEKRNLFSPGGITNIKSCEFWSDPGQPLEDRIKNMHTRPPS